MLMLVDVRAGYVLIEGRGKLQSDADASCRDGGFIVTCTYDERTYLMENRSIVRSKYNHVGSPTDMDRAR